MNKRFLGGLVAATLAAAMFEACSPAHGNSTGHEYMPDMAHSVAYEPNRIDEYSLHTWNEGSVKTVTELWGTPRLPIHGTIPRGYVGISAHGNSAEYTGLLRGEGKGVSTPLNGNVPYYYADNEEERTRATKEIVLNPFPITKKGLERGKELWKIYCGGAAAANCRADGNRTAHFGACSPQHRQAPDCVGGRLPDFFERAMPGRCGCCRTRPRAGAAIGR